MKKSLLFAGLMMTGLMPLLAKPSLGAYEQEKLYVKITNLSGSPCKLVKHHLIHGRLISSLPNTVPTNITQEFVLTPAG